jgi:hypothetical protein
MFSIQKVKILYGNPEIPESETFSMVISYIYMFLCKVNVSMQVQVKRLHAIYKFLAQLRQGLMQLVVC